MAERLQRGKPPSARRRGGGARRAAAPRRRLLGLRGLCTQQLQTRVVQRAAWAATPLAALTK